MPSIPSMDYEVREVPEFYVAGMSLRTANGNGQAAREILPFWERFYAEHLKRIANKMDQDVLGVYTDYESDHTGAYTLLAGCRVPADYSPPAEMEQRVIPASRYAVFVASGEFPVSLQAVWKHIWESEVDRTYLDRTYKADFELYGPRFGAKGEVEVYISIA